METKRKVIFFAQPFLIKNVRGGIMYKKICTKCYRPSFSASKEEKWICPICLKDLTGCKALNLYVINNVLHNMYSSHSDFVVEPQIMFRI